MKNKAKVLFKILSVFLIIVIILLVPRFINLIVIRETKKRFRKNGFIPSTAKNLSLYNGQYMDAHGDGILFISFTDHNIDLLRQKICPDTNLQQLDEMAINTIEIFKKDKHLQHYDFPNLTEAYYLNGKRIYDIGFTPFYGTMILINPRKKRVYYFNYQS